MSSFVQSILVPLSFTSSYTFILASAHIQCRLCVQVATISITVSFHLRASRQMQSSLWTMIRRHPTLPSSLPSGQHQAHIASRMILSCCPPPKRSGTRKLLLKFSEGVQNCFLGSFNGWPEGGGYACLGSPLDVDTWLSILLPEGKRTIKRQLYLQWTFHLVRSSFLLIVNVALPCLHTAHSSTKHRSQLLPSGSEAILTENHLYTEKPVYSGHC